MKGVKEDNSMDENSYSKRRIAPSIPANYISILQLQERWINKKERKRKEEEDLKKAEARGKRVDLDEKPLNRSYQKHWDRNSKINVSIDGGETSCAEKEETSAIRSERGEDAAPGHGGLPVKKRGSRKRYDSKKKRKNQEVAAVKEDVVVECGSIAPPEYIVTENNIPVKDQIRAYRKKGEKGTGMESVGYREKAVTDDATAIETQFEDLFIKRGEESGEPKNLKAQKRSRNRNPPNQRHDLALRRVGMPTETATMVWVKKGQNERANDGIGSGVKPLHT